MGIFQDFGGNSNSPKDGAGFCARKPLACARGSVSDAERFKALAIS